MDYNQITINIKSSDSISEWENSFSCLSKKTNKPIKDILLECLGNECYLDMSNIEHVLKKHYEHVTIYPKDFLQENILIHLRQVNDLGYIQTYAIIQELKFIYPKDYNENILVDDGIQEYHTKRVILLQE